MTCRCRKCHPATVNWTLTPGPIRGEHPGMTLSFLYRAYCRVLQLIRLIGLTFSPPAGHMAMQLVDG